MSGSWLFVVQLLLNGARLCAKSGGGCLLHFRHRREASLSLACMAAPPPPPHTHNPRAQGLVKYVGIALRVRPVLPGSPCLFSALCSALRLVMLLKRKGDEQTNTSEAKSDEGKVSLQNNAREGPECALQRPSRPLSQAFGSPRSSQRLTLAVTPTDGGWGNRRWL